MVAHVEHRAVVDQVFFAALVQSDPRDPHEGPDPGVADGGRFAVGALLVFFVLKVPVDAAGDIDDGGKGCRQQKQNTSHKKFYLAVDFIINVRDFVIIYKS